MLIRHSMTYVAGKVLPGILGTVTTAILTHVLAPAQFGLYGLSLVVMAFGVNIAFDWVTLCLSRFYQGRHGDPMVISTIVHVFAANLVLSGAVFLLIWRLHLLPVAEASSYAMGVVLMWATAWFELAAAVEVVNFRPSVYFTMNLSRAVCVLGFGVTLAWLTRDPVLTAAGTAIGIFVGSLLRHAPVPRLGRKGFDAALAREMVAFGLPLAGAMLMGSLGYTGTRLMVEWLGSPEALGYYTAVFVLVQNMLIIVATGIAAAGYQLAVRAVATGDPDVIRRQLLDNGTLLLAVMAPASLGAALTAKGISVTLVGPQYAQAVASLTPWMAAAAFLMSIRGNYFDFSFQLGHRPILQFRVLTVMAVVSIVLAYWLIPRLGPEGAAIAITMALALACIHAHFEGRAALPMPLPISSTGKILLACGVMSVVILRMRGDTPGLFVLQVIAGGTAYAVSAVVLNVLGSRDAAFNYLITWFYRRERRTDG